MDSAGGVLHRLYFFSPTAPLWGGSPWRPAAKERARGGTRGSCGLQHHLWVSLGGPAQQLPQSVLRTDPRSCSGASPPSQVCVWLASSWATQADRICVQLERCPVLPWGIQSCSWTVATLGPRDTFHTPSCLREICGKRAMGPEQMAFSVCREGPWGGTGMPLGLRGAPGLPCAS